jgi:hypothetical protein
MPRDDAERSDVTQVPLRVNGHLIQLLGQLLTGKTAFFPQIP